MKSIPVNIISGFLGSGKTTAIIRLLEQKQADENWAIVVNEFGKISIDGQILQSKSASGSVFDISGGCICCSAKGYLRENLEKIIKTGSFDRIMIEPSGLGGIEMVSEIIETFPELKVMPVVCIVDITAIGNARLRMNMIYRMQIKKASIIAFSKCDLLTDAPDRDRLMEQFISAFPEKQNCLIQSADLYQELMKIDSHVKTEKHEWMLLVSNQDLTASIYQETTYQFGTDKFFDTEKLTRFFKNHSSIIRAKGFVKTMSGWNLFNFTLSGCTFEPCLPKTQHDLAIIVEQTQQIKVAFDNKSLLHELVLEATTPANMAISF